MRKDEMDPGLSDDEIGELCRQLRQRTLELRQTTYAVKRNRRTPAQRRAVFDRSTRAIRRSALIRRRHALLLMVH
jgi:hypothetical protein